ncbi:AAA family ATPase [Streptomyces sp. NPDC002248]
MLPQQNREKREQLAHMLKRLGEASGRSARGLAAEVHARAEDSGSDSADDTRRKVKSLATALSRWFAADTVPEDSPLNRQALTVLLELAGPGDISEEELRTALMEARAEGAAAKGGKGTDRPRLLDHAPSTADVPEALTDAPGHRALRNRLLALFSGRNSGYVYVLGGLGSGKTSLLTALVRAAPRGMDVACFFPSYAGNSPETGSFVNIAGRQLPLDDTRLRPTDAAAFRIALLKAVEQSKKQGRALLLVIDGIDLNSAWARSAADRPSIAGLLPRRPPAGLYVVVAGRRTALPADVPATHPLRDPASWWTMPPRPGYEAEPAPALDAMARLRPGSSAQLAADVLATVDMPLSAPDLAELTGLPGEEVERVVSGPEGHFLMLDGHRHDGYVLAHPQLPARLREAAGEAGAAFARRAVTHSVDRWRKRVWPPETRGFLLEPATRLTEDPTEVVRLTLDPWRQAALVQRRGAATALSRLDTLSPYELGASVETLGLATASCALLRCRLGDAASPEALRALVAVGETERAAQWARATMDLVDGAALCLVVATELARSGQPGGEDLACEAGARTAQALRDGSLDASSDEQAEALTARALEFLAASALEAPSPSARRLLAHILSSDAVGAEAREQAAADAFGDLGVDAVHQQAARLARGGHKERCTAVGLWAALAQAEASGGDFGTRKRRAPEFRGHIIALCEEQLDLRAEGLADTLPTVDLLSLGARVLSGGAGMKARRAGEFLDTAHELLLSALRGPVSLSKADRGYLSLEVRETITRHYQALEAVHPDRPLADAEEIFRRFALRDSVLGRAALSAPGKVRAETETAIMKRRLDAEKGDRKSRREYVPGVERKRTPSPTSRPRPLGERTPVEGEAGTGTFDDVHEALSAGLVEHARALLEKALPPDALHTERLTAVYERLPALASALVREGQGELAARLAVLLPSALPRVPLLAAASVAHARAGDRESAAALARQAAGCAKEAGGAAGAATKLDVVRALACAGLDEEARKAEDAARGQAEKQPTEQRLIQQRGVLLRAEGLALTRPEAAAEFVEGHVAAVLKQLHPLPDLAELLLLLPDPHSPGPKLREALRTKGALRPGLARDPASATVRALLGHLDRDLMPGAGRGRPAVDLGAGPVARALLAVVEGKSVAAVIAAVREERPGRRTRPERCAEALAAAARCLSGVSTPLPLRVTPQRGHGEQKPEETGRLVSLVCRLREVADPGGAVSLLRLLLEEGPADTALGLLPDMLPGTAPALAELHFAVLSLPR